MFKKALTFIFLPLVLFAEISGQIRFSKMWYMLSNKWKMAGDLYQLVDIYTTRESDDGRINAKIRLQAHIFDSMDEGEGKVEVLPWEVFINIKEAVDGLGIKIGKQYIEWGTADGINPTSVLTPDDSTMLFAGEKIPVFAIRARYMKGDNGIEGIWIPGFTSARVPSDFPLFDTDMEQVGYIKSHTNMPGIEPEGCGKAIRILFSVFDINFSMGYFYGYDYLPQIKSASYILTNTGYYLDMTIYYPRMHVFTFDFETDISGYGIRGELAMFYFKDGVYTEISMPTGTQTNEIVDTSPYINFIMGIDYTFESGFYINLQYAHGLPYFRGEDYIEEYIMLSLKNEYLDGDIEVELVNMFGFDKDKSIINNYEYIATLKITYLINDDTEASLFISQIFTKGSVLFSSMEDYDSIGFSLKYSF